MDARAAPYVILPPCLFIIILLAFFVVPSHPSFVVSHFSFSHLSPSVLLFFSFFLCRLSAPSLMLFFFFFSDLTVKRPGSFHFVSFASTGYLARSQEIRFAVLVTGHRTTCSSYRIAFLYSSCARFAEKLTVIFPTD